MITQPIFDVTQAQRFYEVYATTFGEGLDLPVFFGLQLLETDGVIFSSVPAAVREGLGRGRSGVDIGLEFYGKFRDNGLHNIYLVPPIRRGGARDYAAAREFLSQARSM